MSTNPGMTICTRANASWQQTSQSRLGARSCKPPNGRATAKSTAKSGERRGLEGTEGRSVFMKLLISIGVAEGSNPTLSATENGRPLFGAFHFQQGRVCGRTHRVRQNRGARARMARVNPTLSATLILTRRGLCRSLSGRFHSPPIIRAACRRQRRWVRRVLADIPPRRSHPPTAASPAARRSANAAQAPACRARMNSGT